MGSKKFLDPLRLVNVTTTQRDALSGVAAGDKIWNTTLGYEQIYDGAAWRSVIDLMGNADGEAVIRANSLDQLTAPAANLSMNSQRITTLADPVSAQDGMTKNYSDAHYQAVDGWIADTATWRYGSSTVFTVPGDATAYLGAGTKVSYNDGAVDYGVVSVCTLSNVSLTAVVSTIGTSLFTKNSHALGTLNTVVIGGLSNTTGVTNGGVYWVVGITTNTFQLSLTFGGSAITLGGTSDAAITLSPVTNVTLQVNGTYTIANATLTAPRYSVDDVPRGYTPSIFATGLTVANDTIWAAAGDTVVATGNDAANILSVSTTAGRTITANPRVANKLSWSDPLSAADAQSPTSGLLSTYNRIWTPSSVTGFTPTSGTLYVFLIPMPEGITVSNLIVWAGTTAGASLTHSWMAFSNNVRLQKAISADNTTATWTASTSRTFAMTTPYQTLAPSIQYIWLCIVGTTIPTIEAVTGLTTTGARNTVPKVGGTSDTGLTTPASAPSTAAAPTSIGAYPYIEIS